MLGDVTSDADEDEGVPSKRRHVSDGDTADESFESNSDSSQSSASSREEASDADEEEDAGEGDEAGEEDADESREEGSEQEREGSVSFRDMFSSSLRDVVNDALATFREHVPGLDLDIRLREVPLDQVSVDQPSTSTSSSRRRHEFRFELNLRRSSDASDADAASGENLRAGVESLVETMLARGNRESVDQAADDRTTDMPLRPQRCYVRCGFNESDQTFLFRHRSARKRKRDDAAAHIHRNLKRLTHFVPEANVGRGFIKEISFSSDGRVVASPFGFGLRLLAFDPLCSQLRDYPSPTPLRLAEVTSYMPHDNFVVAAKFSPVHNLLVTGCLQGRVAFHQPVF